MPISSIANGEAASSTRTKLNETITEANRVESLDNRSVRPLTSVGGTSTAYTASASPTFALTNGQLFIFEPHTNSGVTPTLNINSQGAVTIRRANNGNIEAGELKIDTQYILRYTGSFLRVLGGVTHSELAAKQDLSNNLTGLASQSGTGVVRRTGAGTFDTAATKADIGLTNVDNVQQAPATRTITGNGLVTGGGDLTANRTLTVTAASGSETDAGTATDLVITPQQLRRAEGQPKPVNHTIEKAIPTVVLDDTTIGGSEFRLRNQLGLLTVESRANNSSGAYTDQLSVRSDNTYVLGHGVFHEGNLDAELLESDQNARPGDAPLLFTSSELGTFDSVTPISSALVASHASNGNVVRIVGALTIAEREPWRIEPARRYRVRAKVRRHVNSADPANAGVVFRVQWLDVTQTISRGITTVATNITLTTGSGNVELTAIVSTSAGSGILVAPSNAVYGRCVVQFFGSDQTTDLEVLGHGDVTDADVLDQDVTGINTRLTAIETEDLGDRMDVVETYVAARNAQVYLTTAEADVSTIPNHVEALMTYGGTVAGDDDAAIYKRSVSEPAAGTLKFQSTDGAWWGPGNRFKVVDRVYRVSSRTNLQAAAASEVIALLTENGREGPFRWTNSNVSAGVTADTTKAWFIPPLTDTTGASGAWVRKGFNEVKGEWCGASGDAEDTNPFNINSPTRFADSGTGQFQLIGGGTATNNKSAFAAAVTLSNYLRLPFTLGAGNFLIGEDYNDGSSGARTITTPSYFYMKGQGRHATRIFIDEDLPWSHGEILRTSQVGGAGNQAVTISQGANAVVTWPGAHGIPASRGIRFTTTGTLPAPLAANTFYWLRPVVNPLDPTTQFHLATEESGPSGANITTTTAGSGTHTAIAPLVHRSLRLTTFGAATATEFDTNEYFHVEGITFRGRWYHRPAGDRPGGPGALKPSGYTKVVFEDIVFEDIRNKSIREANLSTHAFIHNVDTRRCARGGVAPWDSIWLDCDRWSVVDCDDDMDAHTSTDEWYHDWPQNSYQSLRNGWIRNAEGVVCNAPRGEILNVKTRFTHGSCITIGALGGVSGNTTDKGNSGHRGWKVRGCDIENATHRFNVDKFNPTNDTMLLETAEPYNGCISLWGSEPDIGKVGGALTTVPPEFYNGTRILRPTEDATPAVAGTAYSYMEVQNGDDYPIGAGLQYDCSHNMIRRTIEPVDEYEKWENMWIYTFDGYRNPAMTSQAFLGCGIAFRGHINGATLVGNQISGMYQAGYYFLYNGERSTSGTPAFPHAYRGIQIIGGAVTNSQAGVRRQGSAAEGMGSVLRQWGIHISNVLFDLDPYHVHALRTSATAGTWTGVGAVVGAAHGVYFPLVQGVSTENCRFRNLVKPIHADNLANSRRNTVYCNPAAIGASTSNIGIYDVPTVADDFLHIIEDGAPSSSTYGFELFVPPKSSSSEVVSGQKFMPGYFLKNSATTNTAAASNIAQHRTVGWERLTIGNGNSLVTDWHPWVIPSAATSTT